MIESVLTACRGLLIANSTLMTLIGGGTKVYAMQAPEDAVLPYIVVNLTGGGDENQTLNPTFDVTLSAICVAEDGLTAAQAADQMRTLLHGATPTLTGGWTLWSAGGMRCLSAVLYNETEGRRTYTYAGHTVGVRGYKSA